MSVPKVGCVGLGQVGLHTGISLCDAGYSVLGMDLDEARVEQINRGRASFLPDQLETQLGKHTTSGRLTAATSISFLADCDRYVVTVPTPLTEDKRPDLSYVRAAGEALAAVLDAGDLVVLQSTVPIGCCRTEFCTALEQSGLSAGPDFGIAHIPERYSPDDASSLETPRVVGAIHDHWRERAVTFYRSIGTDVVPVESLEIAEATKLTENIQRDVNIALVNELARVFETVGVDVFDVLDAAATKWNFHRYEPHLGVGGHCLPVDPYLLLDRVDDPDENVSVVSSARRVNESMPEQYVRQLERALRGVGRELAQASVALLGISYKSGVKDVRNSPAVEVIRLVSAADGEVTVYDPLFDVGESFGLPGIEVTNGASALDAAEGTDALVVSHATNPDPSLSQFSDVMAADPVLVDPAATFEADLARDEGFRYQRLGMAPTEQRMSPSERYAWSK